MYILQELVRYISVMTQKEFTYIADELRYDLLAGNYGLISIVSNVQDILQMRTRLEAS